MDSSPNRPRSSSPEGWVRTARRRPSLSLLVGGAAGLAVGVLGLLLILPLVGLFLRIRGRDLFARLGDPIVVDALKLSLVTSTGATLMVIALGMPVAYLLAMHDFRGKALVEGLVNLPMVLPPTVAGLALLMAFGRAGLLGRSLEFFGITLPFTTLGVVVAQAFMATPFFIAPTRAGFASVDRRFLEGARTLGASESYTFVRVVLPLSLPSLLAGVVMGWARSLGEFGATITFAGNLPGETQTMPLAVYVALQSDLDAAVALSAVLITVSFTVLVGLRFAPAGAFWGRTRVTGQTDQTS